MSRSCKLIACFIFQSPQEVNNWGVIKVYGLNRNEEINHRKFLIIHWYGKITGFIINLLPKVGLFKKTGSIPIHYFSWYSSFESFIFCRCSDKVFKLFQCMQILCYILVRKNYTKPQATLNYFTLISFYFPALEIFDAAAYFGNLAHARVWWLESPMGRAHAQVKDRGTCPSLRVGKTFLVSCWNI